MLRSLNHITLTVPDLESARRFYADMGLEGSALGDDLVFRCSGRDQDQVRIIEGPDKRLTWISFGASPEDIEQIQKRVESNGGALSDPPTAQSGDGIWFRDVDGDLVNVRAADAAPQTRPPVAINNPGSFTRLARRGAPDRNIDARPRRLGHLLKFSLDLNRTIDFYTKVLGMKLSDRIADLAAFLRFGGDSDHHTLALAQSEGPGLHHMSFEMGNVDQIQFCAQRMIEAGHKDCWGFGRHIYGSNYFHYVRDPWNSLVEYFWDIDFVPGDAEWEVEVAEANEESLYQWATSPPPEDFLANYERQNLAA
jgi:catechol 2,3-dioxygenase-like lactoylglutathione lyase family enzyme